MFDEESFATYWSVALAGNTVCLHYFGSVPLRTCRGSMSGDYYWRSMTLVGLPYHLTSKRNLNSRTSGNFHVFYFHQPEFALARTRTVSDALCRMTFESRKVVPSAVNGDLVCIHEGISFALIPPPVAARNSIGKPSCPLLRHYMNPTRFYLCRHPRPRSRTTPCSCSPSSTTLPSHTSARNEVRSSTALPPSFSLRRRPTREDGDINKFRAVQETAEEKSCCISYAEAIA